MGEARNASLDSLAPTRSERKAGSHESAFFVSAVGRERGVVQDAHAQARAL